MPTAEEARARNAYETARARALIKNREGYVHVWGDDVNEEGMTHEDWGKTQDELEAEELKDALEGIDVLVDRRPPGHGTGYGLIDKTTGEEIQ